MVKNNKINEIKGDIEQIDIPKETVTKTLDELDLMLMRELEVDARQGYSELGIKLGTSPTTVRRRLQGLLDKGIIEIVTMADPYTLGFDVGASMSINVNPGKVEAVANQLATLNNLHHVVISTGRYDIHAAAIFRDYNDLLSFLAEGLEGISGIANIQQILFIKSVKRSWTLWLNQDVFFLPKKNRQSLDAIDISLIRELESYPRQDIVNLAAKLNISRKTVGRKLERLIGEGIISICSVTDPVVLGLKTQAMVLINAQYNKIIAVADELARFPQIKHVDIFSGDFNIMIIGYFPDLKELHLFLDRELGNVPGILRYETTIVFKVVKRSFMLSSILNTINKTP